MSGSKPRVSVGMPVYNGDNYLAETLESIFAQTFQDFEVVISDNGSTDGTEAICRQYVAKDARVQYHRSETNRGVSWNFRRAARLSSGSSVSRTLCMKTSASTTPRMRRSASTTGKASSL